MTKLSWLLMAVFVLGLAATWQSAAEASPAQGSAQSASAEPVQIAQMPRGGGRGRAAPMSEADRETMQQQMLERMVDQSDLTDREKAAAKQTLKAKHQARKALQAELTTLRRVANKTNPSSKELKDTLAAYRAALAQYHTAIEAQDAALVRQLSLKGQVRCISLGILDNGIGPIGPMAPRGGPGGPDQGQFPPPGFGPPR